MIEAPSHLLPGTNIQYAWDSSSINPLKTCPRLYYYTIIEGWQAKGENIHLRFGQEYHKALEDFDRFILENGATRKDAMNETLLRTWQRVADWEVDEDTKAGKYKNKNSLLRLVVNYLDHYNPDTVETVVLDSGRAGVELSFRFELDWGPHSEFAAPEGQQVALITDETGTREPQPYLLTGHLDRVVRFNDDIFVMDRKTTTYGLSSYYFDQFAPNTQMTQYTLAGGVVLNAPIKGIIIDAAQILIGSDKFERSFTYRTPDQLDEWVGDLRYWFSLAEHYATTGYWPMNDTACDKFGGCKFRGVCSRSPNVRENLLRSDFKQLPKEERWNPLKPR